MQQAINRAFTILEFVATYTTEPVSFSDIAKHSGLNTGTCANILKAMVQRGYLEKIDDKRGYLLGRKMYQLTNSDGLKPDIVQASKAVLDDLTEQFNENALVAVLKENLRMVLYQATSKNDIQVTTSTDKSAYDSSTGRVLIAMLPDDEQKRFIEKYGLPGAGQWKEADTATSFANCIEDIRKKKYAMQETEKHITGFAVPVLQNDKVVAAISIYIPSYRFVKSKQKTIVSALHKAAKAIADNLSHR